MNEKTSSRGFRAWTENEERLRYAESLGLSISEVVNEVLKDHLHDYLKKKTTKLREALSAPVP